MTDRPYSRVYHSIVDDPMFERVFDNDHALATWLRMLLIADAMWPTSAPMTTRNPTVRLLIECGLVLQRPGNRYSIRGLDAERERRSAIARNAAVKRWQSDSNAPAMPRRDETRKDETSRDANASANRPAASASPVGFQPPRRLRKPTEAEILADIKRQHDEAFEVTRRVARGEPPHPSSEKESPA